jgi:pyrroline-5-carboxylate reductase
MQVGLIGSGNMARALARGWGDPVLCTDGGSGRAEALAAELGGEAVRSNAELADRADLIILAHKPAQLAAVASDMPGTAKPVVSLLARTPLEALREALPAAEVFRVQPNTPVEVGRGVTVFAEPDVPVEADAHRTVRELFERVGAVVEMPERLIDAAGATSGVGPAYVALVAEAMTDAAVRRGLPAPMAAGLVSECLAGTAALLAARGQDTLAVRREVTSPGGTTSRGLAALERGGLRAAFHAAIDDAMASA